MVHKHREILNNRNAIFSRDFMQKRCSRPVAGQDSIFPFVTRFKSGSMSSEIYQLLTDKLLTWLPFTRFWCSRLRSRIRSSWRELQLYEGNWGPVKTKWEIQRYCAEDGSIPHSLHPAFHYWQPLPGCGLDGPLRRIWCLAGVAGIIVVLDSIRSCTKPSWDWRS